MPHRGREDPAVRQAVFGLLASITLALALLVTRSRAQAESVVTNCGNDTEFANMVAAGGTVKFNCGTVAIGLGSAKTITADTTIDGGGAITLSGGNVVRLFNVGAGKTLTLKNIVLTSGHPAGDYGGAVYVDGGTLILDHSTIQNSHTDGFSGGAIIAFGGSITLDHSTVQGNYGYDYGAINSTGDVTLINSTVQNNTANTGGGGLSVGGVVHITDSVITNNNVTGGGSGGGGILLADSGHLFVTGGEISGNSAGATNSPGPYGYGGGIYSQSMVIISLTNVTVSGNTATWGGGIYTDSPIFVTGSHIDGNFGGEAGGLWIFGASGTLDDSTVKNNTAGFYGGINEQSGPGNELLIARTTVAGNTATGYGGGIYNENGILTLLQSTVSGNTAGTNAGGIFVSDTFSATNSTISGNTSTTNDPSYGGGGIINFGSTTLLNDTISGNSAATGGGILNKSMDAAKTITLKNTIIANSPRGGNCTQDPFAASVITSSGYNLSSDGNCATYFNKPGDWNNENPNLGPLTDNGGATLTHMPNPPSKAIDGGSDCPTTDQRGATRPSGPACDIGSVEYQAPTPTPTSSPTPTPTHTPTPTPVPTPTHSPTPTATATGSPLGLIQGDVDCNHVVNAVDALKQLRHVASLSVSQTQPCTAIGDDAGGHPFGDVDCDGNVSAVDALKDLRSIAGLPVAQTQPCAAIATALG